MPIIIPKEEKLILLKRKNPTEYEIHRNEINQTKNIIFTTKDLKFAERVVNNFNGNKPNETK